MELRSRLLREATDILARDGFPNLTVRRVADAAGCSTIGIYTHFGGKQGLIEALLLDAYAEFEAVVAEVDVLPAGRAQLVAGAHAYRSWALANRSRYLVMFTSYSPGFVPSEEAIALMTHSLSAHARRVREAMAVGDLAPADVDDVANHIWVCVHGHVMIDMFCHRELADEAATRAFGAAFDRILDGVTAKD